MSRKGANISLSSYDDIFETDESRADSQLEKVQKIPISELVPFTPTASWRRYRRYRSVNWFLSRTIHLR